VRILGALAGAFLGLVFLVAAVAKALDPDAFAQQIAREGLAVLLPAGALALLAIALETALGTALLVGIRRPAVLWTALVLALFFVALTGRAYWRAAHGQLPADEAACGCFGNLVQRSPAAAFWQDVLLLLPPAALAFVGRDRAAARPGLPRLATVGVATAALTLLAWRAPELPLDDLATRLRPGRSVAEICTGPAGPERVCLTTLVPELAAGRHLVVLADLEDPGFGEAAGRLSDYALSGQGPRLWVLTSATPEEHQAFFWRHGPAFEIREAPPALLRPLYRRLPRAFLSEDGAVIETYTGLPPLAGERLAGRAGKE
jgi:uncharacterized membrane protein YphA (DoxX/SURF4 family)